MTPFTDRTGRFSPLKSATMFILVAPALWTAGRYVAHDLGPLPLKELLHVAGLWALRFLVLGLALTPAQRFLQWPKLALVRRMVGLGAACYAAAHIGLYVATLNFDLAKAAGEILARRYLQIGLLASLALAALAITSNDAAVRTLGQRWKTLHRLAYAITALGLLHFFMQAKIDVSAAVWLAGLFVLLMTYRVVLSRRPAAPLLPLLLAACFAAIVTAGIECLWYALASGISPWRVAAANLNLAHGLRPAPLVAVVGLAAAGVASLRVPARGPRRPAIMTCVTPAPVLQRRPESARSSAG